ncbi:hypothetical protein BZA77DRAFT_309700 [Pyronema omphalodes]|nr:hypothetical protein BZA77DRAFT_309700 [Pyronema omphalodes]
MMGLAPLDTLLFALLSLPDGRIYELRCSVICGFLLGCFGISLDLFGYLLDPLWIFCFPWIPFGSPLDSLGSLWFGPNKSYKQGGRV